MTDIIEAIDSATGCQQCGKDLSGSVSDDFCSEKCQRAKRLGLSKPMSARVIAFMDHLGLELDPWQRWWLCEIYPAYLRREATKRA